MSPFNLETCARPNILALQPYHCARDDFKVDDTHVLLDLNENGFGPALPAAIIAGDNGVEALSLHRYPHRLQHEVKQQLCNFRNNHIHTQKDLIPDNVVLGLGSVEPIDDLIRCFCTPGKDRIMTCPPTYGMYAVSAQVNDVTVLEVPLLPAPAFALNVPSIMEFLSNDATIKVAYLTSPGNPTGSLLAKADVEQILAHPSWNGIIVLDEAYIDFAHEGASLAGLVTEYPNLVVLHTLSKAFGLAGIRVGAAYASPSIARLLNNLKAPWNVPAPSGVLAKYAISEEGLAVMRENRAKAIAQRDRLLKELPVVSGIGRIRSGTDSNFLMFEVLNSQGEPDNAVAAAVYDKLASSEGVVVRFRGKEPGCFGCLRITLGTEDEITRFLDSLCRTLGESRKKVSETGHIERAELINAVAKDLEEDVSYCASATSSVILE